MVKIPSKLACSAASVLLTAVASLSSASAWSESYVYLTNNTGQTLDLTVNQRGSSLTKGDHWKQHATSIPPYGTARYLETNRDSGIKWGKDYYFDTTVTAEDGSKAMLQQKLTGTWNFSDIWHGTQQSQWYDDRNIHSVTQDFVGANSTIAFKAEGARVNGDDYYYVIQPKQKTPVRGLSNQFNVMAYNVWALLPSLGVSKSASERLALIGEKIKGYDAIVLSELFANGTRADFLKSIKSEYPYQTSVVDESGSIEDGGVLIVSRWPIETSGHQVYKSACAGSDCIAAKGVKYARINKGGNKYHVFGTHTQAWTTAEGIAARAKQFNQMRSFMDRQNIPASEPVIIAGDLNVDKEDYPQEYASMLNTLSATEIARSGGHKYTADGGINNWVSSDPEILDYVLYSDNHLLPTASSARVLVPRSIHSSVFTKYDLSDHFPIKADITYNLPATDPTGAINLKATTVNSTYAFKLRAAGNSCMLEWDGSLSGNERNAKFDCSSTGDEILFVPSSSPVIASNGDVKVKGLIKTNAKGSLCGLEWAGGSASGGERNAKFDCSGSADPVTITSRANGSSSIVVITSDNNCGLEWDGSLSGGERNAKFDCSPNHDEFQMLNVVKK